MIYFNETAVFGVARQSGRSGVSINPAVDLAGFVARMVEEDFFA